MQTRTQARARAQNAGCWLPGAVGCRRRSCHRTKLRGPGGDNARSQRLYEIIAKLAQVEALVNSLQ